MTRVLFGIVALVVGGLFACGVGRTADPARQPKIPVPPVPAIGPNAVDPKMPYFLVCAKACDDCARSCDLCGAHCAQMLADGKKEHLESLRVCQDCATVCSAASRVVAKDGPLSGVVCTASAEACKKCGDACEKHAHHDPIMKQCADECRKCEKACRGMLTHVKHGGTDTPKK